MSRRDREEDVIDVDAGGNSKKKTTSSGSPAKPKNSADASATSPSKAVAAKKVFPLFEKKGADVAATSATNTGGINLKQYVTDPEWAKALASTFDAPYFKQIEAFLVQEESSKNLVFPPRKDIFTALNVCPLSKVKVVIIGQDPYHDHNQAHGMCFSVLPGVKVPPSLVNMYKELTTDIQGFKTPGHGYLMDWAKQGILMLNATLTVQAHKANSHEKIGWQQFTDKIIDLVNERAGKPVVFLLWGNFAKQKAKRVNRGKHKVIESAHPSPLSANKWFGCHAFSLCNKALQELGEEPIDWKLPANATL